MINKPASALISKNTYMSFKNIALSFLISIALNLILPANVNAGSLNLACRVDGNGTRSIIRMYATGLKGKYYAKVFSDDNVMSADAKPAKRNGVIEFRFDSEPTVIATKPGTIAIAPDFIKEREVAGVLRKAGTRARMGAIRADCSTLLKVVASTQ